MTEDGKRFLLIVDDEVDLREALAFDYERKGFHILMAANGREAFEILQKQSVDIVLSDVRMPGGDGLELLDRIRKANCETPFVIFITGFSDITHAEAYDRGVDAVLAKPFERKVLHETVLRALQPPCIRLADLAKAVSQNEQDKFIEIEYPSLSRAEDLNQFRMGRCGVFISNPQSLPEINSTATFNIRFANSDFTALKGRGIIRWTRSEIKGNLLPGYGVEFLYLEENCRDPFVQRAARKKNKAFIPLG